MDSKACNQCPEQKTTHQKQENMETVARFEKYHANFLQLKEKIFKAIDCLFLVCCI